VAADDAVFIDNTVAMGVCGAEFFNHLWELGVRKAKELLFTSDPLTAEALASAWSTTSCLETSSPASRWSWRRRSPRSRSSR
jgi:hypothetical protein